MFDRVAKLRLTLIILIGLGASYSLAVHRKLIPSIGDLLALRTPIVCPADEKYHTPPTTFLNSQKTIAQVLQNPFDRSKISVLIEPSFDGLLRPETHQILHRRFRDFTRG